MKVFQLLLSVALILSSSLSISETFKICPKMISEKEPFTYGGCSGEACGYLKYYKALRKVELHSNPNDKSKIVGYIEKCESIKDAKFFTSVSEAGEGVIISNLGNGKNLKINDKIRVIRGLGEGYWEVCANDDEIFTATDNPSPPEVEFKLIKQPKTQDWVRLKTKDGILGYAKDSSPRFFMVYYDFDPNGFCKEDHPLGLNFEQSRTQGASFFLVEIDS